MRQLFHTPEGVRDVYGKECEKKLFLQEKLKKVFHGYGYQDMETPTFEFFDVFSKQVGTTPSKDLYKFFDREGNTLVLRPDFTPSIARAASMYYQPEALPIRICYQGSTFVNSSSYQGRLKESTQMGVELIGDASVDADGEIIALTVHLLREAGLKDFQISIGQVDFFKSLIEEAQLSEDEVMELRQLISNKNFFGVEQLLQDLKLSDELVHVFTMLPQLFGSLDILDKAKSLTHNPGALQAIKRLEEIYEVLKSYGCEQYISFDLGMLSKYRYYTGIIFQGYTYGTGEPLVKGGRYNNLMKHFGCDAPAIGFTLVMEQVMNALSRQGIDVPVLDQRILLIYPRETRNTAVEIAQSYRKHHLEVQCMCMDETKSMEDYISYGKLHQFEEVIIPLQNEKIKVVNLFTDEEKEIPYREFQ